MPKYLWRETLLTAAFLYNKTPHSALNFKTPFEAKTNKKPILTHIKVFGSLCYYKDNSQKLKLDPRGIQGILIGFGEETHLYKIWDLKRRRSLWCRDVRIFEGKFLQPLSLTEKSLQNINSEEEIIVDEEDLEIPQDHFSEKNISEKVENNEFSENQKSLNNNSEKRKLTFSELQPNKK